PMLPVFGSFSTKVGVVVAGVAFLICLVQGYVCIRRREIALHREWMIRTFAIGLGLSSFRVLIPLLMIPPLNATFTEAWDPVVGLAFVMNAVVAEAWINAPRRRPQPIRVGSTAEAMRAPLTQARTPAAHWPTGT